MIILVRTDGAHNQYWRGEIQNNSVITTMGRIGTEGQTRTCQHSSPDEAKSSLHFRSRSLTKYRYCSEAEFKILSTAAKILGTANKIERVRWLRIYEDKTMDEISPDEMVNPEVKPVIAAHTIQRSGQRALRNFLFTSEGTFEFDGFIQSSRASHTENMPLPKREVGVPYDVLLRGVALKNPRLVVDEFVDKVAECIDFLLQKGQKI